MERNLRYPLTWPHQQRRTPSSARQEARFQERVKSTHQAGSVSYTTQRGRQLTVSDACDRLDHELRLLGAEKIALSSNVPLRNDGWPRSGVSDGQIGDPGAAVYFTLDEAPVVLACDKWTRVADNIAAIAAHVGAMRGQDRWGVGTRRQAFAGYAALPPPSTERPWWLVLGFLRAPETFEAVVVRHRQLIAQHHPDAGGDPQRAAELNAARDAARAQFNAST